MCAVCPPHSIFRISFIFLHLSSWKWEKVIYLGRYYTKARTWPCKRVIMGLYWAWGQGNQYVVCAGCSLNGVFRIPLIFFAFKFLKNWEKVIYLGGFIQKHSPDPAKGWFWACIGNQGEGHKYIVCAVCAQPGFFRISFKFFAFKPLKMVKKDIWGFDFGKY